MLQFLQSALTAKTIPIIVFVAVALTGAVQVAMAVPDKYAGQKTGGIAFSEFKGYEDWQTVSVSKTEQAFAVILANPVMIEAYRAGIPGNGKPFPAGSKIAKIHWTPVKSEDAPDPTTLIPGTQANADFIVKDSTRFTDPDSGGWGYAAFKYDAATDTFTPASEKDQPPQANDAKCGVACHALAQAKDYIFTTYAHR